MRGYFLYFAASSAVCGSAAASLGGSQDLPLCKRSHQSGDSLFPSFLCRQAAKEIHLPRQRKVLHSTAAVRKGAPTAQRTPTPQRTEQACTQYTHGRAEKDPLSHLSPRSGGKCQLPLQVRGAEWVPQSSPRWEPRAERLGGNAVPCRGYNPSVTPLKAKRRASSPCTGEPRFAFV